MPWRCKMTLQKRLESKVQKSEGGCWVWQSGLLDKRKKNMQYGRIRVNGKMVLAHRIAYEIYVGEIPEGLHVLHSCDNQKCINPQHLHVGTNAENRAECVNKGRQAKGKTHGKCKLTDEQIQEIRDSSLGAPEICKRYGICNRQYVWKIRHGYRRQISDAL